MAKPKRIYLIWFEEKHNGPGYLLCKSLKEAAISSMTGETIYTAIVTKAGTVNKHRQLTRVKKRKQ